MNNSPQAADTDFAHPESTSPGGLLICPTSDMLVKDVMSTDTITVSPDETVLSAAKTMAEHHISCVAVVREGTLVGILTEKDVAQVAAHEEKSPGSTKVAERMWSPTQAATEDMTVLRASRLMEAAHVKWLPVLSDGKLIAVVTQTDLTRALTAPAAFASVTAVMSTDIVTVGAGSCVEEAAAVMTARKISCVLATHRGQVAGILTMKDVLKRVIAVEKHPADIQVVDVMSFPLISVGPDISLFSASRLMDRRHIHRLVVMDDDSICGIVSQTDVLHALRSAMLD